MQTLLAEYVSKSQLAAFVGKAERTIDRWVRARRCPPFVKVGNTILFPVSGVREWLTRHEITADSKRRATRA
jgi:predicted DNA-binding transcriptional regulator AlpA